MRPLPALPAFCVTLALCALLPTQALAATEGQAASSQPDRTAVQRRYLAVVGLQTLGDEAEKHAWVGIGVGEEIATRLASARGQVEMLERLQINELLAARHARPMFTSGEESADLDLQYAHVLEEAAKQNKLYGADAIILGAVGCSATSLRATTRLVSVARGKAEDGLIVEMKRSQAGLETDTASLGAELATKWCEKLGIPVTPEIKTVSVEKSGAYQAWCEARRLLYESKYDECLERVKWAEAQVSDLNLVDGLLKTRDDAWEMLYAGTEGSPANRNVLIGQMLDGAQASYDYYKRAHALAAYYYGRALERAGQLKDAEAKYRECLEQKTNRVLWDTQLDGSPLDVVCGNNLVYATTERGVVAALDPATGQVKWRFDPKQGRPGRISVLGETVCVGFQDWAGESLDHVFALAAGTGALLWTRPWLCLGAWGSQGSTAYCAYRANDGQHLAAVNADNGSLQWDVHIGGAVWQVLVHHDRVLVVIRRPPAPFKGYVLALDRTSGTTLWEAQPTGEGQSLEQTSYADENAVWCAATTNRDGDNIQQVVAYRASTGALLWASQGLERWWPLNGIDGVVYLGTETSLVATEAATGRMMWKATLPPEWKDYFSGKVVRDGEELIAQAGRHVAALQASTGRIRWTAEAPTFVGWHDMILNSGSVLLQGRDGAVLALDEASGSALWRHTMDVFGNPEWDHMSLGHSEVVFLTGRTSIRCLTMGASEQADLTERATIGLARCLTRTSRADVAWRLSARLLWENGARSPIALQVAAEAKGAGGRIAEGANIYRFGWVPYAVGAAERTARAWDSEEVPWTECPLYHWDSVFTQDVLVSGSARPPDWQYGLRARDARTGDTLWESGNSTSHVVADHGRVYFRAGTGELRALDARTGRTLWTAKPATRLVPSGCVQGRLVCVREHDPRDKEKNGVCVLDANTGALLWNWDAPWPDFCDVRVDGSLLYVSTAPQGQPETTRVSARDSQSGAVLWERDLVAPFLRPMAANGVAFTVSRGHISAQDGKTGALLWSSPEWVSAVATGSDGTLYSLGGRDVTAYDPRTGKVIWRSKLPRLAWDLYCTPEAVVCGGIQPSCTYALAPNTGAILWTFEGLQVAYSGPFGGEFIPLLRWDRGIHALLVLVDVRNGQAVLQLVGEHSAWADYQSGDILCAALDNHLLGINLKCLRPETSPEVLWLSQDQYFAWTIWGKGALGARKALDGISLDQILKHDHWRSKEDFLAELQRLCALGDWQGEKAPAEDPGTLCPSFLGRDPELVGKGVDPVAQFLLRAAQAAHSARRPPESVRAYLREAHNRAPNWAAPKQMLGELLQGVPAAASVSLALVAPTQISDQPGGFIALDFSLRGFTPYSRITWSCAGERQRAGSPGEFVPYNWRPKESQPVTDDSGEVRVASHQGPLGGRFVYTFTDEQGRTASVRVEYPSIRQLPVACLTVPAAQSDWATTGVVVKQGDRLHLHAEGTATYGYEGAPINASPVTDPDGNRTVEGKSIGPKTDPNVTLPTAPVGALIGCVQADDGTRGTPFLVGRDRDIVAGRAGTLMLLYNEVLWDDDIGAYTVRIERR